MNTIVKMKFGSHLYGTNTPESDTDYKGVFMPTPEQILLGRIPKCYSENTKVGEGKNTSEDIDTEIYSFHYFIKLACEGQTVAIDMLNAPMNMITDFTPLWWRIVEHKDMLISKSMSAFMGYVKRQAAKYGIKGSRLAAAKKVMDFIRVDLAHELSYRDYTLKELWNKLPEGEHIAKEHEEGRIPVYNVCGKKIQWTAKATYLYGIMDKFYTSYGERARKAEKNEGIDWKAVSHAMRACYELEELYSTGNIHFPLEYAGDLKEIKAGKHDYKTEVAPNLERWIEQVEKLAKHSKYPEKVNVKFWDKFIYTEIIDYLKGAVFE